MVAGILLSWSRTARSQAIALSLAHFSVQPSRSSEPPSKAVSWARFGKHSGSRHAALRLQGRVPGERRTRP